MTTSTNRRPAVDTDPDQALPPNGAGRAEVVPVAPGGAPTWQGWSWRGPLAGRYPAAALMVMVALIPYLALSAALDPLTPIIAAQLHTSNQTMSLSSGLGNAAYAVGTVLAVQFAQHLPQRRMLIGYAGLLVVGSVLAAAAQDPAMYIAGHTIQGLCTSLLLIAAVPPLALGFPADKFRDTAVIMSICIFGAVALGPLIGGVQASHHAWRPLFWIIAGVAATALVLVVLTFEDAPPADRTAPKDPLVILLAGTGCVAAFFGVSQLTSHPLGAAVVIAPLLGGLAAIVALITYQHRAARPLLTISDVLTSSIPAAGVIIALFAAAASVSASALTASVLASRYSPVHVGLLYVPELAGAVITALALGRLITRRSLVFLPLVGMVALGAGIGVFLIRVPSSQALTLVGSGLTGIGLGATVAPALFIAGMSLRSMKLQRVFAMVELLRAVAAFLIAPIFAYLAVTASGGIDHGTRLALWISLGLTAVGTVGGIAVYALSGARPETPDLDEFLEGDSSALTSPPLLALLRRSTDPAGVGEPARPPSPRPAEVHAPAVAVTAPLSAGAGVEERRAPVAPASASAGDGDGAVGARPAPVDAARSEPRPVPVNVGPSVEGEPTATVAAGGNQAGAGGGPTSGEQPTHELSISLTVRYSRSRRR